MDLFAVHGGSFAQFQSELGGNCPTFVWNSATFNIIPGSASNQKPLGEGGFSDMYNVSFDVLASQFTGFPTPYAVKNALLNTKLVYQGQTYKVMDVKICPNNIILTIDVNSLNQKA